ncbi:MAG: 50S ribosomal protein L30 [archaeon]|nr:MAG: 50S ribosomal protein L30 [archaeon]
MSKIAVIRIRGLVGIRKDIAETLNKLRLRKKFVCIILEETPENMGMIQKVENFVAYEKINESTLKELILKRGRFPGDKKLKGAGNKLDEFVKEFVANKKKLKDFGIKPFFRLHPPLRGFKKSIKLRYPKGILGKNEKINELIKRML